MIPGKSKKAQGQLRLSQTVTTFGPGSMLDLPQASVLVAGLDHWFQRGDEILEPRLVERLKDVLQVPSLQLFSPPVDLGDPLGEKTGITVWQFPTWFIVQDEDDDNARLFKRARQLVPQDRVVKGRFKDEDKKGKPVVPVRFVRACRSGHIEDLDWYGFAHGDPKDPCRRRLWLEEAGTTGDLRDIFVRCDCGKRRPLSDATVFDPPALGFCRGMRPWLGPKSNERCGEPSRLLIRSASNAYFPQTMSAISLPERNAELEKAVDQLWDDFLSAVEDETALKHEMKKAKVERVLKPFSPAEVLKEILARKGRGGPTEAKSVKVAEVETLTSAAIETGEDRPDGTFFARAMPKARWSSAPGADKISSIVRVHRLREVVALTGFTRFESFSPDAGGELEIGVTRAALSTELHWLPAVENRGEGLFLSFDPKAIEAWRKRPAVARRADQLLEGFEAWKKEKKVKDRPYRGLPYVMLHSLSHLLLTSISLECGYPASSIRERVYAFPEGYGILLYTGSPDAEGTLGGLVEAGLDIAKYLRNALDLARLCSNDPVCAQHDPSNVNERRFLHGAACHGCLLIAETSCEMSNDYLDRSLVVPTVADPGAAFFE